MQIGPGKGFQRLSFRTPLNRALLMTSFTSSIDITPVNTLTLVQKWTYEIGPSNSLFILSGETLALNFPQTDLLLCSRLLLPINK